MELRKHKLIKINKAYITDQRKIICKLKQLAVKINHRHFKVKKNKNYT